MTGPGPIVTATSNLALSADSICYRYREGEPARPDDVRITSATGSEIPGLVATIVYGPGQPTGWLTTSFDQTTTPARLWLNAPAVGGPVGNWWADVKVTAPTGGDARVIRVHYSLRANAGDARVNIQFGGFTAFDLSPGYGAVTGIGFGCDNNGGYCDGSGFSCDQFGGYCDGLVEVGTVLRLTATPGPDSRFLWWETPECHQSQLPTCVFTVTQDVTVTAFFYLEGYTVSVTVVGAGADGNVTGGFNTGNPGSYVDCSLTAGVQSGRCGTVQSYGARNVGLEAVAGPGSVFIGWSGDCNGSYCSVEPNPGGSRAVTATFAKQ